MGHGWNNNNLEKKTMNVTVTVGGEYMDLLLTNSTGKKKNIDWNKQPIKTNSATEVTHCRGQSCFLTPEERFIVTAG